MWWSCRRIRWRAVAITVCGSPPPPRAATFSRCSSTPRKARRTAWCCWRTSCAGSRKAACPVSHLKRMVMQLIPAIDLKDGKCVRLKQGRMEDDTVFSDDPVAVARHWVERGARRLHLVDLNGAFAGEPVNGEIVKAIAKAHPDLPIQIGGGIRNPEIIQAYLDAGVQWVIIGTKAVKEPAFVKAMCEQFPGHIIVGLDAKDGMVATDGWANVTDVEVVSLAQQFEN